MRRISLIVIAAILFLLPKAVQLTSTAVGTHYKAPIVLVSIRNRLQIIYNRGRL